MYAQKRIVSLSPAATEILCALGAQTNIVARTDFCDYPASVSSIPSVGGFDGKTFSYEKIMSFRPDMVYLNAGMHEHLIAPLEKYGIRVYMSKAESIAAVLQEITDVSIIIGHEKEGKALVSSIKNTLHTISARIDQERSSSQFIEKTVYWEVWNNPYMSAGGTSFISDIITHAGGINIFADTTQQYPTVSEESILKRNPDVILYPSDAPKPVLSQRKGWKTITAVQNNAVYAVPADIVSRPGARIALAVEAVAKILYPSLF